MKKYIILYVAVCLFLAPQTYAGKTAKPAFLYDIRSLGMGGAGIAAARGTFSYIYNPALLAKEKFSVSVPGIQLEICENLFEVINYASENEENFKKLDKDYEGIDEEEQDEILNQLRVDAAELDNIWYKSTITPVGGAVFQNFGISVYNVSHLATKLDVGIIIPKIIIYALNDLVISFGYGYQYDEKLALGIGAKIINRRESPEIKVQVEEASTLEDTFNEGFNEMQKGTNGFGLDIGALYQLNEKIELAAMAQDLLGKVGSDNTPMNIKIGMMYQYNENLTFAADIEDFFNRDGDKFVNKIYFGGEYKLPIISFRLGFGQGYPAVGLGINLSVFELAYTYYSRELTHAPGLKDETYHLIGFRFGWL